MTRRKFDWAAVNEKLKEVSTPSSSGSFSLIDDTVAHASKLVGLVFCGEEESTFAGETKIKNNIMLIWALDTEEGEPRVFSNKVALSSHDKSALCKFLKGWGKSFSDLGPDLLDQDALTFYENREGKDREGNAKMYTNLTRVAPPKKAYEPKSKVFVPKWIVAKYGEDKIACGEYLELPEMDD